MSVQLNKSNNLIKILLGSFCILALCVFIQLGPTIVGYFLKFEVQFMNAGPNHVTADLSSLSAGNYYLSLGRVLDRTEVWIDQKRVFEDEVILGGSFEISESMKSPRLDIYWKPKASWRNTLFEVPIVACKGTGFLLQTWRVYNRIYLGPFLSFFLVIVSLANWRISRFSREVLVANVLFGCIGLLYNVYVSSVPDLFWEAFLNTFVQVFVRICFSGAFIYLVGSYHRQNTKLLLLHIPSIMILAFIYFYDQSLILLFYQIHLFVFTAFTFAVTFDLLRSPAINQFEIMLLAQLSIVWTLVQGFSAYAYLKYGPNYFTVWSPSFITLQALANFYLLYRVALSKSIQLGVSKRAFDLSAQVAHDIRSPVAALRAVLRRTDRLPNEEKVLTELAIQRIDAIARDLLDEHRRLRDECSDTQLVLIKPLLQRLIQEKEVEYREQVKISLSVHGFNLDVLVQSNERNFERVISNLINNSFEAIGRSGEIRISLAEMPTMVELIIADNGNGISEGLLQHMKETNFSSVLTNGNGLGLRFAYQQVKAWGGQFKIEV